MRVLIEYNEYMCGGGDEPCEYIYEWDCGERSCPQYQKTVDEKGLTLHCATCQRVRTIANKAVKKVKSIEISIDRENSYAKIGRRKYWLNYEVDLLKVDYEDGRGFVTEWDVDRDWMAENVWNR